MSATMQQVFCVRFGDPEQAIELRQVGIPSPAPDEVLIRMEYCPINPADLLLLSGRHFYKPTLPAAVGIEGTGRVEAVGSQVTAWQPGDRVAVPFGGTWRQWMALKATEVIPLPPDLDPQQASMMSVNPITAVGLLDGIPAGSWILQNAANSAVGQLVIRLAAQQGIHTVNIVRRPELVAELQALGADVVVVGEEDLPARVQQATQGAAVVRGLDAVAGESSGRLYRCLSPGAELVCYGLLSSDQIILGAADVVFGSVTIRGYTRLGVLKQRSPESLRHLMAELSQWVQEGILSSPIEAVFPLEQVHTAVAEAARPGRSGKILLQL
ncbi:MAG: zinc-binding dehydrogenase [Synechococcales cyanobacterium]